jgi:hypothetical protein
MNVLWMFPSGFSLSPDTCKSIKVNAIYSRYNAISDLLWVSTPQIQWKTYRGQNLVAGLKLLYSKFHFSRVSSLGAIPKLPWEKSNLHKKLTLQEHQQLSNEGTKLFIFIYTAFRYIIISVAHPQSRYTIPQALKWKICETYSFNNLIELKLSQKAGSIRQLFEEIQVWFLNYGNLL